jgi:hypothetical protein
MKNRRVKSVFDWLLKRILKIDKGVLACAWKKREEKRNGLNHNMQGLGHRRSPIHLSEMAAAGRVTRTLFFQSPKTRNWLELLSID